MYCFIRKIFFWVLISFCFVGCEFQPEGEVFVEVPEPDLSDIEINLESIGDTIRLFASRTFSFDFKLGNRERPKIEVMMDKFKIRPKIEQSSFSFYLNPRDYELGIYNLNIKFSTNSGSGTFADVSGSERIFTELDVILIIDTE